MGHKGVGNHHREPDKLSVRETEFITLLTQGKTIRQAALAMGVSEGSGSSMAYRIKAKLMVDKTSEAVAEWKARR